MQLSDNFRCQVFWLANPLHKIRLVSPIFLVLAECRLRDLHHADLVQISHALPHPRRTPIYDAYILLPHSTDVLQRDFVNDYFVLYLHQLLAYPYYYIA